MRPWALLESTVPSPTLIATCPAALVDQKTRAPRGALETLACWAVAPDIQLARAVENRPAVPYAFSTASSHRPSYVGDPACAWNQPMACPTRASARARASR